MVSIEETAKRHGYNLMFAGVEHPNKAQLAAAIDALSEQQIDGLVLGVRVEGRVELIHKLCRGVPLVALDGRPGTGLPTVIVDQSLGSRLATQHLLDLGHRQIACIAGPRGWSASNDRRKAWAQTLKKAGLVPGPCIEGDWSSESGYAAATQLLEMPGSFTAIVSGNDHMALGALRALHASGIQVPSQVSVVGYDDLPESRFFEPPLTTIHHDFVLQGERCVEVLLRLIKQEPVEPPLELLSPELVVRGSTAAARR
jgi:DNA-binding LacI/PurR family transcriptional regulator